MATNNRPTRATLAEHINSTWRFAQFAVDTTVEELLNPETWAHVASKFTQGDEIVVVPQGMPFRAHLIVVDAGKVEAKVRLIDVTPLNAAPAVEPVEIAQNNSLEPDGPMFVKWNPGSKKYAIHRSTDKEKVHDGFAIKAESEAWAAQHALAMAA
jgi:hypothetical protein